jgi:hypothetical protein
LEVYAKENLVANANELIRFNSTER